jgi:hypothetical protein
VLNHSQIADGYHIGPKGNDPLRHTSNGGYLYYNYADVTKKEESKAVTKFNKGDKVRFNDKSNTAWFGVEGIVERPASGTYGSNTVILTKAATGWASNYTVGSEARLGDYNLELVEPEFSFKDIQVGDTIRRTRKHEGGATEVREGVAGKKGSWYWATKDDQYILAYEDDDRNAAATIELLSRPEPEPTLLEGTKAGDQLVLKLYSGATKVYTRNAKDQWNTLVFKNGEYSHVGFVWDTVDLEGEAKSAKSHKLLKV